MVKDSLTQEQQDKLKKFRDLLSVTKSVKDIVTDEVKQVTSPSPMMAAYTEKSSDYVQAVMNYHSKRIAAQSAVGVDGKAAVLDFASNAQLYRMQAEQALRTWESDGYKGDVEEIQDYISQVTQRSMVFWLQGLIDRYNDAKMTNPGGAGDDYLYATPIPGNFATSKGWTTISSYSDQLQSSTHYELSAWGGSVGLNWGLWSVSGGVQHSSSDYTANLQVSNFHLTMDMAQVMIHRPWFFPEFFMNRGWTLSPGHGWTWPSMPSDGAKPPATKGTFIGYPTAALFVRNVAITSSELTQAYHQVRIANQRQHERRLGAVPALRQLFQQAGRNLVQFECRRADADHSRTAVDRTGLPFVRQVAEPAADAEGLRFHLNTRKLRAVPEIGPGLLSKVTP